MFSHSLLYATIDLLPPRWCVEERQGGIAPQIEKMENTKKKQEGGKDQLTLVFASFVMTTESQKGQTTTFWNEKSQDFYVILFFRFQSVFFSICQVGWYWIFQQTNFRIENWQRKIKYKMASTSLNHIISSKNVVDCFIKMSTTNKS